MSSKGSQLAWFTKHSDLLLAAIVVMILSLMIMKVNPHVMDVLLGANIAISATVLLVALYVPNAMKLPSFPTILRARNKTGRPSCQLNPPLVELARPCCFSF